MLDEGIDTIYLEKTEMKGNSISLVSDKGEGSKKRGGAVFVELVAMWDTIKERIRVLCLGIQGAGNSSMDATDAEYVRQSHQNKINSTPLGSTVV